MARSSHRIPVALPVLSRGRHRNYRRGACFMELAAYLAGERWSDHPVCTHPLLAQLARLVNDHTSNAHRSELAELIPRVIGLTSDDLRVDARIAIRCARLALPVVSAERQNAMAVAVLMGDRILAELDRRPVGSLEAESVWALDQAPLASRWAIHHVAGIDISTSAFRGRSAPHTVRCAVQGIAEACVSSSDELLRGLLIDAIHDCVTACGQEAKTPPSAPSVLPALDPMAVVPAR